MKTEVSTLRTKFLATGRPVLLAVAVLLLALSAVSGAAHAEDAKAREIMQKVNDRDEGDNQTSDMEMILIDKRKNKRIRRLKSFRKDRGKDTLSLLFFLSPADVKNTGFLTYDYDASGKDDDQWLYLPALGKTKRIASSDKSGSFMGSDFNYSDLTEPDLEDYDYKLLKQSEKVKGVDTWRIQSTPRRPEVADKTGYSKSVLWVRKDNFMVIRSVRWVYKSSRRKFFQVKKLEKIDGIWVATEMQTVTKQGKRTVHSTILRFKNVKFNQNLKDRMFTTRRLEKGL
ncbi:MAG: outer membrane lipoprotein-sorting protein [SAR324 cluster bacterium]|nr:outer membrane lipoprotein-sorting protein [SAR324 cluster bacterium]